MQATSIAQHACFSAGQRQQYESSDKFAAYHVRLPCATSVNSEKMIGGGRVANSQRAKKQTQETDFDPFLGASWFYVDVYDVIIRKL